LAPFWLHATNMGSESASRRRGPDGPSPRFLTECEAASSDKSKFAATTLERRGSCGGGYRSIRKWATRIGSQACQKSVAGTELKREASWAFQYRHIPASPADSWNHIHKPQKLRRLLSGHWLATNCSSRFSP